MDLNYVENQTVLEALETTGKPGDLMLYVCVKLKSEVSSGLRGYRVTLETKVKVIILCWVATLVGSLEVLRNLKIFLLVKHASQWIINLSQRGGEEELLFIVPHYIVLEGWVPTFWVETQATG